MFLARGLLCWSGCVLDVMCDSGSFMCFVVITSALCSLSTRTVQYGPHTTVILNYHTAKHGLLVNEVTRQNSKYVPTLLMLSENVYLSGLQQKNMYKYLCRKMCTCTPLGLLEFHALLGLQLTQTVQTVHMIKNTCCRVYWMNRLANKGSWDFSHWLIMGRSQNWCFDLT